MALSDGVVILLAVLMYGLLMSVFGRRSQRIRDMKRLQVYEAVLLREAREPDSEEHRDALFMVAGMVAKIREEIGRGT